MALKRFAFCFIELFGFGQKKIDCISLLNEFIVILSDSRFH